MDYDDSEPIACWEAVLLLNWTWEAYEIADTGLYHGRVKSPLTEDRWEYGYFTADELAEVKAYRVDDAEDRLFPGNEKPSYDELAESIMDKTFNEKE